MKTILIVDDEKDIVEAIEYNLEKEGYKVIKAFDGQKGLDMARQKLPDLVVLDLMLPLIDGLDVCKTLKADPKTSDIPVIMLTAKGKEIDKVLGLELGAEDYMTKPFGMMELVARIKAILKRRETKKPAADRPIRFDNVEINTERHEVLVSGKPVELTAREFDLLKYLAENSEKVFSREKLLDRVWGIEIAIETRTVDVHVKNLREKLGKAGKHIKTLRGVGYKISFKDK